MVTGTQFNYFMVCHRKLWLFSNGLNMEHTSDLVYEGKLVHENSYPQRAEKYTEIEIDGIKIDYFDVARKVIHEIKKTDKHEDAHEWQVKYYIFVLERNGIEGVTGLLEYPKMRETTPVVLSDDDRQQIRQSENEIQKLITAPECPGKLTQSKCTNCSYFDFCWSGEEDISANKKPV